MSAFTLKTLDQKLSSWVRETLTERWGSTLILSRGRIRDASNLPGYVAIYQGRPAGLITYHFESEQCEIVTLDSLVNKIGIGSALIDAVKSEAIKLECKRVWLITTNDNLAALRFYQKRGFHLVAVHQNAIAISRQFKSQIPLIGLEGIPIRDEIELEFPIHSP